MAEPGPIPDQEPSVDAELELRLARIFSARDRNDMSPTIDALLPILEEHPNNPQVLYEMGGAHDTAGQSEKAMVFYERALAAGLSGDALRRCYLQMGSTLRNLERIDESLATFGSARKQFHESASLAVFEALSLHAGGRSGAAVANLLKVVADHVHSPDIDRYEAAIRGNAAHLAAGAGE